MTLRVLYPVVAAAAVAASPAGASAQERPEPVALENTHLRSFQSARLQQDFRLMIGMPFGRPTSTDGKFPVIYLLDADISFPMVRQVALSLQGGLELPPALIVGIAYEGGMRTAMTRRSLDYTPTPDPRYAEYAVRWEGGRPGAVATGGAKEFLAFVRDELKPFVESTYPADPTDATIIGASFGGLFAAYALFEAPDTFQRYVLSSPALWWGDEAILGMERRFAAAHDDLRARVFIAAGGRESKEHDAAELARAPEPMRSSMLHFKELFGDVRMVELIEPFVQTLRSRAYAHLDLTMHVFPDETHGSTPPMAISRGLRVVFGSF